MDENQKVGKYFLHVIANYVFLHMASKLALKNRL
jgi:hypothetical protein